MRKAERRERVEVVWQDLDALEADPDAPRERWAVDGIAGPWLRRRFGCDVEELKERIRRPPPSTPGLPRNPERPSRRRPRGEGAAEVVVHQGGPPPEHELGRVADPAEGRLVGGRHPGLELVRQVRAGREALDQRLSPAAGSVAERPERLFGAAELAVLDGE